MAKQGRRGGAHEYPKVVVAYPPDLGTGQGSKFVMLRRGYRERQTRGSFDGAGRSIMASVGAADLVVLGGGRLHPLSRDLECTMIGR